MTIPFYYVTRRKATIKGMAINAMFFGCRVSGEKNGILGERLKLVSTFLLFRVDRIRSSEPHVLTAWRGIHCKIQKYYIGNSDFSQEEKRKSGQKQRSI